MLKKYKIIGISLIFIIIFICVFLIFFKLHSRKTSASLNEFNIFQNQELVSNIIENTYNNIVNETVAIQNKIDNNEELVSNNNSIKENTSKTDKEKNQTSTEKNKTNKVTVTESNKEKINTSKNNTNSNTVTGDTPYFIRVNYGAQVVTIYKKDNSGNYTIPYKSMLCSTGTDTPKSGIYKIPGRWNWGGLVGDVYGQYITVITGEILFHSVPYLERYNPGSLDYEEYDKLGTPASAGCVRLTVEDALWIWNNCENGTKVEFYSSNNPGPLGKPTAKKISDAEGDLKNWDPTDPDKNNPWNSISTTKESQ